MPIAWRLSPTRERNPADFPLVPLSAVQPGSRVVTAFLLVGSMLLAAGAARAR
jgi:hypothetical protein